MTNPIAFWDKVTAPKDITAEYPTVLRELYNEEYRSAQIEFLKGWSVNGEPVVSVRAGGRPRLLFTTTYDAKGERCLSFIEALPTHNYERSRFYHTAIYRDPETLFADHKVLTEASFEPITIQDSDFPLATALGLEASAIDFHAKPQAMYHYQGRFICLDESQANVLIIKKWPLILSGAPGSGKSCVGIRFLANWATQAEAENWQEPNSSQPTCSSSELASSATTCQPPRYFFLAKSTRLVEQMHRTWRQQPEAQNVPADIVSMFSYVELLRQADSSLHDKTILDDKVSTNGVDRKTQFAAWYKRNIKLFQQLKIDGKPISQDAFYQECLIIMGCKDLATYQNLGKMESQFFGATEAVKTEAYKLCHQYINFLWCKGYVDPLLHRIKQPCISFSGGFIDEAQDLSPAQLLNLGGLTSTQQLVFAVDSHQNIGASTQMSIRPFIKKTFKAHPTHLIYPHRCPDQVIAVANASIRLQRQITGGSADKEEYAEMSVHGNRPGHVTWPNYENAEALAQLKQEIANNPNMAVITRPELKSKIKALLDNHPLVFDIEEIKGFEYETVILWDLLSDAAYYKADKLLKDSQGQSKTHQHLPKDKQGIFSKAPEGAVFNHLFTALTRSTRELRIFQIASKDKLKHILEPLQAASAVPELQSITTVQEASASSVSTSVADRTHRWLTELDAQLDSGHDDTALAIWTNNLGKDPGRFAAYKMAYMQRQALPGTMIAPSASTSTSVKPAPIPRLQTHKAKGQARRAEHSALPTVKPVAVKQPQTRGNKGNHQKNSRPSTVVPSTSAASQALFTPDWRKILLSTAKSKGWAYAIENFHTNRQLDPIINLSLTDFDITTPEGLPRVAESGVKQLIQLSKYMFPKPSTDVVSSPSANANPDITQMIPGLIGILLLHNKKVLIDLNDWVMHLAKIPEKLKILLANGDLLFLLCSTPKFLPILEQLSILSPTWIDHITSEALLRKKRVVMGQPHKPVIKMSVIDLLTHGDFLFLLCTKLELLPMLEQISRLSPILAHHITTEVLQRKRSNNVSIMDFLLQSEQGRAVLSLWHTANPDLDLATAMGVTLDHAPLRHFSAHTISTSMPEPSMLESSSTQLSTDISTTPVSTHDGSNVTLQVLTDSLHMWVRLGDIDTVKVRIAAGDDVHECDTKGRTILFSAVESRNPEMITYVSGLGVDLEAKDNDNGSALEFACMRHCIVSVRCLLELGANPNTMGPRNLWPLSLASPGPLELSRVLLDYGANPNTSTPTDGLTILLSLATMKDTSKPLAERMAMLQLLCDYGADTDAGEKTGAKRALHFAAKMGKLVCVKHLIAEWADVNVQDSNGSTPLHLAVAQGHKEVVSLLLACGANLELSTCPGAQDIKIACAAGELQVTGGRTPLTVAVMNGHKDMISTLVGHGACIDACDEGGKSALRYACDKEDLAIITMLIQANADVHSACKRDNWTPLFCAAYRGYTAGVAALLESGRIDLTHRDKRGRTVLQLIDATIEQNLNVHKNPQYQEIKILLQQHLNPMSASTNQTSSGTGPSEGSTGGSLHIARRR